MRWVELAHLALLGREKADKRGAETERERDGEMCVADMVYKKMCIESTLRSEDVIKEGVFPLTKGIALQSKRD